MQMQRNANAEQEGRKERRQEKIQKKCRKTVGNFLAI